ncbi:MAG: substrate-binding domain-containing protein [Rubrivivax sp.]|nr:substrate-binding domain-containing protein [Rubrivivax sp.]
MATRAVLAELAAAFERHFGIRLQVVSVGGVDAARRVAAGEAFDLVFLAADAIDKLIAGGHLEAGSRADLVRSPVAVAVKPGTPRPDLSSEEALRRAVRAAPTLGYSTGPSGTHLVKLFERWGLADELARRTVQAPPGVPVASLVAQGEVALGFQQLSELMNVPGVDVAGLLPGAAQFITTFSAGLGNRRPPASQAAARAALAFMATAEAADIMRRHGMDPA